MEHDGRVAIQKLIQDNINNNNNNNTTTATTTTTTSDSHDDDDAQYQLALSHLLSASQLELLKRDEVVVEQSKDSTPSDMVASVVHKIQSGEVDGKCSKSETDEVVEELKKVKKQNFVTHCLLAVMIVISVGWKLSEVSLLLKVKDGIKHPFRSFTSMLKGMFKVPDMNGQDSDNKEQQSESPSLPSLIPEMPQMDVSNLGLHNGKD